jgi:hypothetical protein
MSGESLSKFDMVGFRCRRLYPTPHHPPLPDATQTQHRVLGKNSQSWCASLRLDNGRGRGFFLADGGLDLQAWGTISMRQPWTLSGLSADWN